MPIDYDHLDPGHRLAAMISRDVLSLEKNFKNVFWKIKEYNHVISSDDVIKNFYEIVDESPLFKLCEYISNGKDNYGMTEDDFKVEILDLVKKTNEMFDSSIDENDVIASLDADH